ncbi:MULTISPECIES: DUF7322 domain-containing protein [Halolamina]|uniref:DUF7322 domain-containing protein n=1 Tax=Halolamina pelagica TaxID=699431 RepID=A0A1I5R453_9EURY|nr:MULTISPECIES: hypothetical protein [Halolamina]NHX35672.1 hypothetical protein [Halolamina sp. R1-12]SFP53117.1 hypothetical protein SAMN05216277_104223 [Halolamina pelagica]
MSDDDPVEGFVEGSVEPFDESDESYDGPKTRDMEAELRDRTGVDAGGTGLETGVDSETASAFWAAVIYVNAGVLLVALGPVVYALRGLPLVSAVLVAGGVVAFLRAYSVYREFDATGEEDAAGEEASDASDGN